MALPGSARVRPLISRCAVPTPQRLLDTNFFPGRTKRSLLPLFSCVQQGHAVLPPFPFLDTPAIRLAVEVFKALGRWPTGPFFDGNNISLPFVERRDLSQKYGRVPPSPPPFLSRRFFFPPMKDLCLLPPALCKPGCPSFRTANRNA